MPSFFSFKSIIIFRKITAGTCSLSEMFQFLPKNVIDLIYNLVHHFFVGTGERWRQETISSINFIRPPLSSPMCSMPSTLTSGWTQRAQERSWSNFSKSSSIFPFQGFTWQRGCLKWRSSILVAQIWSQQRKKGHEWQTLCNTCHTYNGLDWSLWEGIKIPTMSWETRFRVREEYW